MFTHEFFKLDDEIIKNKFFIKEKNLMIWPLIRTRVLYYLITKKYNLAIAHADLTKLSLKNFRYIYNSLKYAPYRLNKRRNIIYYVNARGRLNNKNFNIDADYYSSLLPNTLVIDESYRWRYYIPNNTDNFATGEYGELKAFLLYQIKRLFSKKNNQGIERFIEFLKIKVNIEEDFAKKVKKKLYLYYFGYDFYRSYLKNVFKKLDPKVIFVRTASYGGFKSILLKTAKENGILTGEFQHGTLYEDHFAYNYGNAVCKNEQYKKYLPDHILTYGDYWNDKINIPSKTITIGNPHFYENIKKYKEIKEQKDSILIISQGTITDKFVNIAKYLSKKLPNYRILFKLHPGEVSFEDRYKELYKYANIEIAKSGDVYKYIAQFENIVACYSTTIFESLGFNKKLFILDNDMSKKNIPEDIGVRFKENEELKDLILNTKALNITYNLEYYFNSNWEENYIKFLREEVGLR
ncbi:hypothetical protein LCGC14_0630060 [marine sediment metagenome]|uniref:Uncharacterized protein n=1 Tax=marine sediment metagenome TaxID=412755 RepID=A0A0F9RLN9_9ZZZZ